jgi:hypothetical protein
MHTYAFQVSIDTYKVEFQIPEPLVLKFPNRKYGGLQRRVSLGGEGWLGYLATQDL